MSRSPKVVRGNPPSEYSYQKQYEDLVRGRSRGFYGRVDPEDKPVLSTASVNKPNNRRDRELSQDFDDTERDARSPWNPSGRESQPVQVLRNGPEQPPAMDYRNQSCSFPFQKSKEQFQRQQNPLGSRSPVCSGRRDLNNRSRVKFHPYEPHPSSERYKQRNSTVDSDEENIYRIVPFREDRVDPGDVFSENQMEPYSSSKAEDYGTSKFLNGRDFSERSVSFTENQDTNLNLRKRKLSPVVYNDGLSESEKRQRRMRRFGSQLEDAPAPSIDLKSPEAVSCSLNEIINLTGITYKRRAQQEWSSIEDDNEDRYRRPTRSKYAEREVVQIPRYRPYAMECPVRGGPGDARWGQKLRPIVIDGSNVALAYGDNNLFECKGIQICVEHFVQQGHEDIIVVVPESRMFRSRYVVDGYILNDLKKEKRLMTSFSRKFVYDKWINSYDDRMILDIASAKGAVIVSNDQFRDLYNERPEWKETIRNRLLPFRFVPGSEMILFPQDPLGRHGPTLEEFLHF